ncbi:hypothetical protein [Gandjariella thermophila]|nr:hypothetical protein [Gandjariella thermophila]
MSSDVAADPVVTLRRTVDAALAELGARSGDDPADVARRSWQVAERLDRALPGPLLHSTEAPLVDAVSTVAAAREHLRFAEAMEACTLLSAARGQLRRVTGTTGTEGAGAEGSSLYHSR